MLRESQFYALAFVGVGLLLMLGDMIYVRKSSHFTRTERAQRASSFRLHLSELQPRT